MNRLAPASAACALAILTACAPDSPFPDDAYTISATRPITDVERSTLSFDALGVSVSNDFEGGRFSTASVEGDSILVLQISPENAPINNSAWYAFKVWSASSVPLTVRLTYQDGDHRYAPKVRTTSDPEWQLVDSASVLVDDVSGDAIVRLSVGPDTVTVAGQEMSTSADFEEWIETLSARDGVTSRTFGSSARGRPIHMVEAGSPHADRHILLISRQHPPEVTGTMALMPFVEEMLGESTLAEEFRSSFRLLIVPLMNPDGVDLGHWRHNTGGIDLNRDWVAFHQPETTAVRDEMARIMGAEGKELWFFADFHSTDRDVFYTMDRAVETRPADVLDPWIEHIATSLPGYEVEDAPSSNGGYGVVSRDWAWREYQAPGMVYEVGDDTPRSLIEEVARTAAQGTMEILLERAAQMDDR